MPDIAPAITTYVSTKSSLLSETNITLGRLERELNTKIAAMMGDGKDVSQGEMLALQYEMQNYTIIFNISSTIQKELSDAMKSIASKI
jgi:type III secretion apparatus needle protein